MLKKTYYFLALVAGILSIISLWTANFSLISFPALIIGLILTLVLSFFILKKENIEKDSIKKNIPVIALALFILLFLLFSLGPDLINPFTCSDLMNHSHATRLMGVEGGFDSERFVVVTGEAESMPEPTIFSHNYPLHLRATTALFYTAVPNAYLLNSVYPILLLSISILGFYFVSRKFLDERYSLISVIIYAFAITNFLQIEASYLNQLFGQFFFIAAFLAFLDNRKMMLSLFLANLIAFPHYFAIFVFFLMIQARLKKDLKLLVPAFLALLIILPEVFGLVGNAVVYSDKLRYFALLHGGISAANLFGILILLPAIFGIYFFKKKNLNELNSIFFSIVLMIAVLISLFVANLSGGIGQLYMPVKITYLLFVITAIYSAAGFKFLMEKFDSKKIIVLMSILLIFNAFYFVGYSTEIPKKTSFDHGYYASIEKIYSF